MKTLYVHPDNPQPRLMSEVVSAIKSGKIIILPTENGYRFGFGMHAKEAFDQLKRLGVTEDDLVLICQNISQLSEVAMVSNAVFAKIKNDFSPNNHFILTPTKMVNKKIISKKTLSFGTSAMPITTALLQQLSEPMFISRLRYQGTTIDEYFEIADKLDTQADVFVDIGEIDEVDVIALDLNE